MILRKRTFIFIFLIWMLGNGIIYCVVHFGLQKQIDEIWIQTVHLDRRCRLIKVGENHRSSLGSSPFTPPVITLDINHQKLQLDSSFHKHHTDDIDRENRTIQSVLSIVNPVNSYRLDSIFQSFLRKDHIDIQTAVKYYNAADSALAVYSSKDSNFYASAIPTATIKTGLDNKLEMTGYFKISPWENIVYGRVLYIVWLTIVGCCIGLFIGLVYYVRKKQCECTNYQICFYLHKRELATPDKTIRLTPFQCQLFDFLYKGVNHFRDYRSMLSHMWSEHDEDKKKLEQQRRLLQEKLKEISEIEITTIPRSGYQMRIPERVEILYKN